MDSLHIQAAGPGPGPDGLEAVIASPWFLNKQPSQPQPTPAMPSANQSPSQPSTSQSYQSPASFKPASLPAPSMPTILDLRKPRSPQDSPTPPGPPASQPPSQLLPAAPTNPQPACSQRPSQPAACQPFLTCASQNHSNHPNQKAAITIHWPMHNCTCNWLF